LVFVFVVDDFDDIRIPQKISWWDLTLAQGMSVLTRASLIQEVGLAHSSTEHLKKDVVFGLLLVLGEITSDQAIEPLGVILVLLEGLQLQQVDQVLQWRVNVTTNKDFCVEAKRLRSDRNDGAERTFQGEHHVLS